MGDEAVEVAIDKFVLAVGGEGKELEVLDGECDGELGDVEADVVIDGVVDEVLVVGGYS